jgi:hypothetical protein
MAKIFGTPIAQCPACRIDIGDAHPYKWCANCGKYLPADVLNLLLEAERTREAKTAADLPAQMDVKPPPPIPQESASRNAVTDVEQVSPVSASKETPEEILDRIEPLDPYAEAGDKGVLVPGAVSGQFILWSLGVAVGFAIASIFLGGIFLGGLMAALLSLANKSLKKNWPSFLVRVVPPRLTPEAIRARRQLATITLRTTPVLIAIVLFATGHQFDSGAAGEATKLEQEIKELERRHRDRQILHRAQSNEVWAEKLWREKKQELSRAKERIAAINLIDRVYRPLGLALFTFLHLQASFVLAALKRVEAREDTLSEIPDDLHSRLIYLRAFSVDYDPVDFKEPFDTGARLTARPPTPTSLEEDVLAAVPDSSRPLCLGRPGEKFPSSGAQRIYFTEEDWRDAVRALVQTCALVLVRTADTPSLVWEIRLLVAVVPPDRFVLWHSGGQGEWDHFATLVNPILPHPLPRELQAPGLLRFDADWTPRWLSLAEAGLQKDAIAKELGRLATKNRPSAVEIPLAKTKPKSSGVPAWAVAGVIVLLPLAGLFLWQLDQNTSSKETASDAKPAEPVVEKTPDTATPVDTAALERARVEEERRTKLAAQKNNALSLLGSLKAAAEEKQFVGDTGFFGYRIRLKAPPWTRGPSPEEEDTFNLGEDVTILISYQESALKSPTIDQLNTEVLMELEQGSGNLSNIKWVKITRGKREWIETTFEVTGEEGPHWAVQRLTAAERGSAILLTLVPSILRAEYEPAIREAFDKFTLISSDERDKSLVAELDQGKESRVHVGAAGQSIRLGTNWQVADEIEPSTQIFQLGDKVSLIMMAEDLTKAPRLPSLDDYTAVILRGIIREFQGKIVLENPGSTSIAGKRWAQLRYRFAEEGRQYQRTAYYHVTPKHAFQLTCTTHLLTEAAHDQTFAPILRTFKFP